MGKTVKTFFTIGAFALSTVVIGIVVYVSQKPTSFDDIHAAANNLTECGVNVDPENPLGNPSGTTLAGITWVRMVFQDQGGFAVYDPVINDMYAHGVKVLLILNHQTYWGNGTNDWNKGNINLYAADFAAKIKSIVTHYGNKVQAYEIWNEPDGVGQYFAHLDPLQLKAVADAATPVIHQNSAAKVVLGGFQGSETQVVSYLNVMPDTLQQVDAVSVHPYTKAPDGVFINYLDTILAKKNKLWITEFSWRATGYTDQAQYINDFYSFLDNLYKGRVEVAILYAWSDGMQSDQGQFGLVDINLVPKQPLFSTFLTKGCAPAIPTPSPSTPPSPSATPTVKPSPTHACVPSCAMPPSGCYYKSNGIPCSCGTLVCATPTPTPTVKPSPTNACVPSCAVPPAGCYYKPNGIPCSCGTIVCATPTPTSLPSPTPAAVSVVCGPLDSDGDGRLTILDFVAFARVYNKYCSDTAPTTGCKGKDSNGDHFIGLPDLLNFIQLYSRNNGVCPG